MSNVLAPAHVLLCGFMSLENRRAVADKPLSFTYDALFNYGNPTQVGFGSFRHFVGHNKKLKQDNCYETTAKVIAFKKNRNECSPQYGDEEMLLMGEIRKMQPLSLLEDEEIDETIQVTGSGTVTSADKQNASFVIYGTQYTPGGNSSDEVVVRGRMDQNAKWTNPAKRVPDPQTVVQFSGTLHSFESFTPPGKSAMTCIVVALDDITYLQSAPAKTTGKQSGPTKKVEGNLRSKLRGRTQAPRKSPENSPPDVSETQLGKRKAQESEEEVDKTM